MTEENKPTCTCEAACLLNVKISDRGITTMWCPSCKQAWCDTGASSHLRNVHLEMAGSAEQAIAGQTQSKPDREDIIRCKKALLRLARENSNAG